MENLTLEQRLEKLLKAYSHHYDIERDVVVEGGSFPATATAPGTPLTCGTGSARCPTAGVPWSRRTGILVGKWCSICAIS